MGDGEVVMAIDPGFTGAIALYDSGRHTLTVDDMPTCDEGAHKKTILDIPRLLGIIERNALLCDVCVVERVAAMPKQGVGSAFRFGYVAGAIDALVRASGNELVKITPAQWKLRAGIPPMADRAARKTAARERAMHVFPEVSHLFSRVKDDGRAEAALMAWGYAQTMRARGAAA